MRLHKQAKNMSCYINAYICKTANVITYVTTYFHVAPIWLVVLELVVRITRSPPTGLESEGWCDNWNLLQAVKLRNITQGVDYIHGEVSIQDTGLVPQVVQLLSFFPAPLTPTFIPASYFCSSYPCSRWSTWSVTHCLTPELASTQAWAGTVTSSFL